MGPYDQEQYDNDYDPDLDETGMDEPDWEYEDDDTLDGLHSTGIL